MVGLKGIDCVLYHCNDTHKATQAFRALGMVAVWIRDISVGLRFPDHQPHDYPQVVIIQDQPEKYLHQELVHYLVDDVKEFIRTLSDGWQVTEEFETTVGKGVRIHHDDLCSLIIMDLTKHT